MNDEELRLDPLSISIFLTVVDGGSITKAAQLHRISQPAASLRIRELEKSLSMTLLSRHGPMVTPTKDAAALIEPMRAILDANKTLTDASKRIKAEHRSEVKLAVSMTIAEYLLPIWLSDISNRSDIRIESVEIGNSAFVIEKVLNDEANIGLIEGASTPDNLNSVEIFHDHLVLVATAKYLKTKKISRLAPLKTISNCDFILRETGSGTRDVFEIGIAKLRQNYNVVLTLPSTTAIKGAVARSLGIGVLSRLAVENELTSGAFVEVAIQGLQMSRSLRAIYKSSENSKDRTKFLEAIMS